MKCKNCGSEWKATGYYSQIVKCPFCGKSLSTLISDAVSFDEVLKSIFAKFGVELLMDKHKFISVFSDIAPKMKREKKILTVALDQNIAKNFVNTPVSAREMSVRKTLRELEVVMSEEAIYSVLSSLIIALEWNNCLIDLLPSIQSSLNDNANHSADIISKTIESKKDYQSVMEDSWEQYQNGYNYEFGENGCNQNYAEAVKWYKLSANQGNAWAQNRLGDCYKNGIGIRQNKEMLGHRIDWETAIGMGMVLNVTFMRQSSFIRCPLNKAMKQQ